MLNNKNYILLIKINMKPVTDFLMLYLLFFRSKLVIDYHFRILFIFCLLGLTACTSHRPAVHLYDGTPKSEKKLAALWYDNNSDGFSVDGQSKIVRKKREIVDEYFVQPGKRHLVFHNTIISGSEEKEVCTTNTCPPCYKEKVCGVKTSPLGGSEEKCKVETCEPCTEEETCYSKDIPLYKTVKSKKISLRLEAGHKYFIKVKAYEPPKVEVWDLGINPKLNNPVATGDTVDYLKAIDSGKIINH